MVIVKIGTTLIWIAVLAVSGTAQTSWLGEYFFGEDGGETSGGTKIYIAHSLKIGEKDGKLFAHLYSQGFQTSRDLHAVAKSEKGRLNLYLEKIGPDNVADQFAIGDLLLGLENGDGKTLTYWGKFMPILNANRPQGKERFVKAKDPVGSNRNRPNLVRLVFKENLVSIAVPDNYLLYRRKKGFAVSTIFAGFNGIDIKLTEYGPQFAKLGNALAKYVGTSRGISKSGETVIHSNRAYLDKDEFKKSISFTSPKKRIILLLSGKIEKVDMIGEFLKGIAISGEPFLSSEDNKSGLRNVNVDDLATSAEVKEALKRAPAGIDRRVSYEIRTNLTKFSSNPEFSRNYFLVSVPYPQKPSRVRVQVFVQLRKDGQIGDMRVFSSARKDALKKYINLAQKIKFVPAIKNGNYADAWALITYPSLS